MATRKELIDQARADQRSRSLLARADNPKSAIVGIGDRDPLTGQYQVMLPDGSVEMGEKQFNSSLPKGSQVLGVPHSGGWLLDERDVQPIKPTLQPLPMGKIQVLFSTIEGADRVFWIWGDRPKPKRVFLIPAATQMLTAMVTNLGKGKYIVGLHWESLTEFYSGVGGINYPKIYTQAVGSGTTYEPTAAIGQRTSNTDISFDFVKPTINYMGHGFWQVTDRGKTQTPGGAIVRQPSTFTFYKGEIANFPGAVGNIILGNAGSVLGFTMTLTKVVRPGLNITTSHDDVIAFGQIEIINPVMFGDRSSIYVENSPDNSGYNYRLIFGDINRVIRNTNPADSFPDRTFSSNFTLFNPDSGNLVGNQYFAMSAANSFATNSLKTWVVKSYQMNEDSTISKDIDAKVIYTYSPDHIFHSASYHP